MDHWNRLKNEFVTNILFFVSNYIQVANRPVLRYPTESHRYTYYQVTVINKCLKKVLTNFQ